MVTASRNASPGPIYGALILLGMAALLGFAFAGWAPAPSPATPAYRPVRGEAVPSSARPERGLVVPAGTRDLRGRTVSM
jgi:hypothetical protein